MGTLSLLEFLITAIKRESCNGRGPARGKHCPGALFLVFGWHLFNKSQQRAAECPAREQWAVVVGLWVNVWGAYMPFVVTGHFVCPLCVVKFSICLCFPCTS